MDIIPFIKNLKAIPLVEAIGPKEQYYSAVDLLAAGRPLEALDLFQKLFRGNQASEGAFLGLSLACAALGQLENAFKMCEFAKLLGNAAPGTAGSAFYEQYLRFLSRPQTKTNFNRPCADSTACASDGQDLDADSKYLFSQQGNGQKERLCIGWYRGEHCNFLPTSANLKEEKALEKYLLKGWLPEKPIISKKHFISTFGSCFAFYLREYLKAKGYTVGVPKNVDEDHISKRCYVVFFSEGLNNTFALLQQFEWAYENKKFSENLWYGSKYELADYNEEVRLTTQHIFDQTDVFIITIGLSEVWYNKLTGEVFWRAIPKDKFDPQLHGFRVTTVDENLKNLEKIYTLIRKQRGDIPIVFTLSPVPLIATFRPVSCITANSVSKSILRVAVDELMRGKAADKNLYYFPSYEIVKEYYPNPFMEDNRHVKDEVPQFIMDTFSKYYLVPE